VHLEREKPPAALWLAWLAPKTIPTGIVLTVETIWRAYDSRWPIEPGLHFRKETLGWTRPRFQSKEAGDRWTWLTALATWIIFLARPVVQDALLPWQKPQPQVTPTTRTAKHSPDFCADWHACSNAKTARNSAWLAFRQAQDAKNRFPIDKKTLVV